MPESDTVGAACARAADAFRALATSCVDPAEMARAGADVVRELARHFPRAG